MHHRPLFAAAPSCAAVLAITLAGRAVAQDTPPEPPPDLPTVAEDASPVAPAPTPEAPPDLPTIAADPAAPEAPPPAPPGDLPLVEDALPIESGTTLPLEEGPPPGDSEVLVRQGRRVRKGPRPIVIGGETLRIDYGGLVQYDFRFRPLQAHYGTWYNGIPSPNQISRNEAMLRMRLGARLGKFGMKTDVDFVARAFPVAKQLADLSQYNTVSPFRFEINDLYAYAQNLAPGLDVRAGWQKAMFGVGDQFNPTNNVNPLDLEDVLLFGDRLGQAMLRVDYAPAWNWQFTGILVPAFKPALLPDTAYLAQSPDRYPFVDDQTRWNFNTEQALGAGQLPIPGLSNGQAYPVVVRSVNLQNPAFNAKNMQQFFRVGTTLGGQDIAVSYYRGFSDIPSPVRTDTYQDRTPRCFQASDLGRDPSQRIGPCIDGTLQNDVTLGFPAMQVLGYNMTGEFNAFKWLHKSFKAIGYRFELAVIFPQKSSMDVIQHDVQFSAGPLGTVTANGPYQFPNRSQGVVIDDRPFAKWTLGLDYTFNSHIYMNTQWVHGFPDEFGAGDWISPGWTVAQSGLSSAASFGDCVTLGFAGGGVSRQVDGTHCAKEYLRPRLSDYLVIGVDFKFAAQAGLFRLFTIWDVTGVFVSDFDAATQQRTLTHRSMFTSEGFSAVIYPDFRWNFGKGFELHAGGLFEFGKPWTKFGAAETGGHQVWMRGRFSF